MAGNVGVRFTILLLFYHVCAVLHFLSLSFFLPSSMPSSCKKGQSSLPSLKPSSLSKILKLDEHPSWLEKQMLRKQAIILILFLLNFDRGMNKWMICRLTYTSPVQSNSDLFAWKVWFFCGDVNVPSNSKAKKQSSATPKKMSAALMKPNAASRLQGLKNVPGCIVMKQ